MSHELTIPIPVLHQSLNIAMHYLEKTGQAYPLSQTERFCAEVIHEEWRTGKRHPVWLANKAIVTLEKTRQARWFRVLKDALTA